MRMNVTINKANSTFKIYIGLRYFNGERKYTRISQITKEFISF